MAALRDRSRRTHLRRSSRAARSRGCSSAALVSSEGSRSTMRLLEARELGARLEAGLFGELLSERLEGAQRFRVPTRAVERLHPRRDAAARASAPRGSSPRLRPPPRRGPRERGERRVAPPWRPSAALRAARRRRQPRAHPRRARTVVPATGSGLRRKGRRPEQRLRSRGNARSAHELSEALCVDGPGVDGESVAAGGGRDSAFAHDPAESRHIGAHRLDRVLDSAPSNSASARRSTDTVWFASTRSAPRSRCWVGPPSGRTRSSSPTTSIPPRTSYSHAHPPRCRPKPRLDRTTARFQAGFNRSRAEAMVSSDRDCG